MRRCKKKEENTKTFYNIVLYISIKCTISYEDIRRKKKILYFVYLIDNIDKIFTNWGERQCPLLVKSMSSGHCPQTIYNLNL